MKRVNKVVVGVTLALCLCGGGSANLAWAKMFQYSTVRTALMPIEIQFADRQGKRIDYLRLKGGEVRKIFVDAVDRQRNGMPGDDYVEQNFRFTVPVDIFVSGDNESIETAEGLLRVSPDLRPHFESAADRFFDRNCNYLGFTSSDINAKGLSQRPQSTSWRIAELSVSAPQQIGDSNSKFPEQQGFIEYSLRFGISATLGDNELPSGALEKRTNVLQATIRPSDHGGADGNNGGGSCDMLAWGAALLPLPGLFFLRRRRK